MLIMYANNLLNIFLRSHGFRLGVKLSNFYINDVSFTKTKYSKVDVPAKFVKVLCKLVTHSVISWR